MPSTFDQSRGLWARTSPKVISANMSPRGNSEPMAFGAQGALGSWLHTWHWQPLMLWLACWQDTSLPAQPSTDGPTRMLRLWRMMHRDAGRVLDISSITKESLEELTFDRDLKPTLLKRCAEGTIISGELQMAIRPCDGLMQPPLASPHVGRGSNDAPPHQIHALASHEMRDQPFACGVDSMRRPIDVAARANGGTTIADHCHHSEQRGSTRAAARRLICRPSRRARHSHFLPRDAARRVSDRHAVAERQRARNSHRDAASRCISAIVRLRGSPRHAR